jgi:hypothetical protein
MVSWGYIIESMVFEFVLGIEWLLAVFQIAYVWKLPHNQNRVKILQKVTLIAIVANNILGIVTCIDVRGVFRIFPNRLIFGIALFMTVPAFFAVLVWYKVFTNIAVSGVASGCVQKTLLRFSISYHVTAFLMIVHILLVVGIMTYVSITRQLWILVFMFAYFDILAFGMWINSWVLCFIFWKQYRDTNLRTLASMGDFTVSLTTDDTASKSFGRELGQSEDASQSISKSSMTSMRVYKTRAAKSKRRRKLKTVLMMFFTGLIAMFFSLSFIYFIQGASSMTFTLEAEFRPDLDNYEPNFDILTVFSAYAILGIVGTYNVWLPSTSRETISYIENSPDPKNIIKEEK